MVAKNLPIICPFAAGNISPGGHILSSLRRLVPPKVVHPWQAQSLLRRAWSRLNQFRWYWACYRFAGKERVSGKVVVITGANRGLGLGLTKDFLRQGATVMAVIRPGCKREQLESLRGMSPADLLIEEADLANEASIATCSARVRRQLSRIDLLINNAGIFGGRETALERVDVGDVRHAFAVNALAPLLLTKELLPLLRRGEGKVLQITSELGSTSSTRTSGHAAYSVSKAALNMVTRMLANMLPELIIVSIYPGWVRTDMGGEAAPLDLETACNQLVRVMLASTRLISGEIVDLYGRLVWP